MHHHSSPRWLTARGDVWTATSLGNPGMVSGACNFSTLRLGKRIVLHLRLVWLHNEYQKEDKKEKKDATVLLSENPEECGINKQRLQRSMGIPTKLRTVRKLQGNRRGGAWKVGNDRKSNNQKKRLKHLGWESMHLQGLPWHIAEGWGSQQQGLIELYGTYSSGFGPLFSGYMFVLLVKNMFCSARNWTQSHTNSKQMLCLELYNQPYRINWKVKSMDCPLSHVLTTVILSLVFWHGIVYIMYRTKRNYR